MDFTTVIQTRRSIRSYDDCDIDDDVLDRVLDAARIAPSAVNIQPWRFVVVKDAATRSRLARLASEQNFVGDAPVVIVCCAKRYPNPHNWMGENLYLIDVAIAIDHLVLAARNEGIGTCWIGAFHHEPIKQLIGVPDDHDIIMLIPLGYPDDEEMFHPNADRLALDAITFQEKFGQPRS